MGEVRAVGERGRTCRGAAPPSGVAPRAPVPPCSGAAPDYSAGVTGASVPVRAALPYQWALDFGVRVRVA